MKTMKNVKKVAMCAITLIFAGNVFAADYALYRLFDDATPSEVLGTFGSLEECNLALDKMRRNNPSQHFFCNKVKVRQVK